MSPPDPAALDRIPFQVDAPHLSLALRHALIHERPGLWADDPGRPSTLAWAREGDDGRVEAFGAGSAWAGLGHLRGEYPGRTITLLAPDSWQIALIDRGERFEVGPVVTWSWPGGPFHPEGRAKVRRLDRSDGPAFEASAPSWALRAWGDFASLIDRGAAFGVPSGEGFASLAWVQESDGVGEKVGVATLAPFRKLGLARSAAGALLAHILRDGRREPLWVTNPANRASVGLARSLGFADPVAETLVFWRIPEIGTARTPNV